VVRIGRALIVSKVTAHARRIRNVVVVVNVAVGAQTRRNGVHARKRESGTVVVERCIGPRRCVVALLAGLREVSGDVVRIRGRLIILQVATDAGRAGEVVVVINVAVGAQPGRDCVAAGKRKSHRVVIESGIKPGIGAMAGVAGGGESGGDMVRIHGRFEIRRVTRVALG